MRNISWLAAIGLAVGCATSGPSPEDTAAQQQQAAQSLQAAADAQNRANYEQQKADQANSDAINAQQDAAQQRQYAANQTARAQQSQADAQRLEYQAHQQGAYAQQQALADQQAQAGAAVPPPGSVAQAQVIEGQVVYATDSNIRLRTLRSGEVNLAVLDFTRISMEGQEITHASNLLQGEDVRATFQVVDGQPQALRVRVHSAMSPIPQTH